MANSKVDLSLVASLLRGISLIAGVPPQVQKVISFIALGIELDLDVNAHLSDLDAMVKNMVKDNRPPDSQEMSDLHARSDAAHAAIQGTPVPTPALAQEPSKPSTEAPAGQSEQHS